MASEEGSTPRRRSRWDRPPPPHDWRWAVGSVGKVLIAAGLLMFGFVGYQLWGTGVEYAQAQDRLDEEFDELLASVGTVATTTTTTAVPDSTVGVTTASGVPTTVATTPVTTPAPPPPEVVVFEDGDVIGRIEIPAIGLDSKVVQGVAPADLKQGPGHYPDTPMPGQLGNA
ncbi:MAG: sortase domain-containing protein, partial [Actinomycetes bacterium]